MRRVAAIIVGMIFFGCNGVESEVLESACESPESFVAHVLDTVRTYSIYRDSADWYQIETDAHTSIANAESITEAYRTVDRVLRQSGDDHAWFRRPEPEGKNEENRPIKHQNPTVERIAGEIGYLVVPAAMSLGVDGMREYARALQSGIRRLSDAGIRDWIVDLRSNWGGDMWPMLAGLGPFLGHGMVGHFVYPDGSEIPWSYSNGAARLGESTIVDVDSEPYDLQVSNPRIAVLIGDGTSSSGEAVVVAFRGLAGVKTFGSTTSGMTTAIEGKRLCDGSVVGISTAAFADRDSQIYSGKLVPDVPVEQTGSGDAVLGAAREWMNSETTSPE